MCLPCATMDYMCPHTSSLVQIGGIAALDNMEPVMDIVKYYLENARLVREALDECGIKYVCAGVGGVCVWVWVWVWVWV